MIWVHQWGKTACDSFSYRSEHNEEDTAINPPKTGGKIPRKRGGVREAHNQYKHSIKWLQRGFWTVFRFSSAEKAEGETNMFEGWKAKTICHILCMEEYSGSVSHERHCSSNRVTTYNTITLITVMSVVFIFSRKLLTYYSQSNLNIQQLHVW